MKARQWIVSLAMLVFGAAWAWAWAPMPYITGRHVIGLGVFWGSFTLLVFLFARAARPWREGAAPDRTWNGVLAEATGPVGVVVFLVATGVTTLVVAEATGLLRALEWVLWRPL